MTSSLLGFDLLPALSEGDERCSLSDLLAQRDCGLGELELWAVCHECCAALATVQHSPDVFQALCITPDTLAFDAMGCVCLLDLCVTEPESMYIAPEYESLGNSFKAHLFSLGMTMLYAAEYNSASKQRHLGSELSTMITSMTTDDFDARASLQEVLAKCESTLADMNLSSTKICQDLVTSVRREESVCEDSESMYEGDDLSSGCSSPRRQGVFYASQQLYPNYKSTLQMDSNSNYGMDSYQGNQPSSSAAQQHSMAVLMKNHEGELDLKFDRTRKSPDVDYFLSDSPKIPLSAVEFENIDIEGGDDASLTSDGEFLPDNNNRLGTHYSGLERDSTGTHVSDIRLNLRENVTKSIDEASSMSHCLSEVGQTRTGGQGHVKIAPLTEQGRSSVAMDTVIGSIPCSDVRSHLIGQAGIATGHGPVSTTQKDNNLAGNLEAENEKRSLSHSRGLLQTLTPSLVTLNINASPQLDPTEGTTAHDWPSGGVLQEGGGGGSTPLSPLLSLANSEILSRSEKEQSDINRPGEGKLAEGDTHTGGYEGYPKTGDLEELEDSSGGTAEADIEADSSESSMADIKQPQSVYGVCERLGYALHEGELWGLCRQCMLALLAAQHNLPAYISPDTVQLEGNGCVTYCGVPDDKELDTLYLAPELQTHGEVTEQTSVFGVATMLWTAADYKLPDDQEPALSEQFENLLMSMTLTEPDLRPTIQEVLKVCEEHDRAYNCDSLTVCQALASEAHKAQQYGRSNALVKDVLAAQIESQTASHKAQVVDAIRGQHLQSTLKPASERHLPSPLSKEEELTLHDRLMSDLQKSNHKLRKSSKPKVMSVQEIFRGDPDLMNSLKNIKRTVTKSSSETKRTSSAFTAVSRKNSCDLSPEDSAVLHNSSISTSLPLSVFESDSSPRELVMPQAYSAPATHFKPIILSRGTPAQAKQPQKEAISGKTKAEVEAGGTRELPKVQPLTEEAVAKKIKELKKNLMKNRLPLSLAQDIENDVMLPWLPDDEPSSADSTQGAVSLLAGDSFQSQDQGVYRLDKDKSQYSGIQDSQRLALAETSPKASIVKTEKPVTFGSKAPQSISISSNQNSHSQSDVMDSVQLSPNQVPSFDDPEQHSLHTGASPTSLPQGDLPVTNNSSFPFQVQLQHDPRTGFYQVIPVAVPAASGHVLSTASPASSDTSSSTHVIHKVSLPHAAAAKPPTESETDSENTEPRRRYVKHASKDKGQESRTLKHKSRRQETNDTHSSSKAKVRKELKIIENGEGKVKSSGSRKHGRSFTIGSIEIEAEKIPEREKSKSLHDVHKSAGSANAWDVSIAQYQRTLSEEHIPYRASTEAQQPNYGPSSYRPSARHTDTQQHRHRIKRAKSGSSLDYRQSSVEMRAYEIYDDTLHQPTSNRVFTGNYNLSKSQPNLDGRFLDHPSHHHHHHHHPRSRRRRGDSCFSPDLIPSPPLSPSWSKDSGVSSLYLKGTGDPTLMERLLNSDTMRHQRRLSRVIRHVRDEFAFDGYMENGIEDLQMAEYILSLGGLRYQTFMSAITEKFCDLYWEESLLSNLYEAVNGHKPLAAQRGPPKTAKGRGHENTADHGQPLSSLPEGSVIEAPVDVHQAPANNQPNTKSDDCYENSAFRPIVSASASKSLASQGSVFKPRVTRLGSQGEQPAGTSEGERSGKEILRSSSLHSLGMPDMEMTVSLGSDPKTRSQGDLVHLEGDRQGQYPDISSPKENGSESCYLERGSDQTSGASSRKSQTRVIYVRSSTDDTGDDVFNDIDDTFMPDGAADEITNVQQARQIESPPFNPREMLSPSSGNSSGSFPLMRKERDLSYPSSSQSNHSLRRLDSASSASSDLHNRSRSQGSGNLTIIRNSKPLWGEPCGSPTKHRSQSESFNVSYKEEQPSHVICSSTDHPDKSSSLATDVMADDRWLRVQGSAIMYYWAELEENMRPDLQQFVADMDPTTKEGIEASMCGVDQERGVEERNKRRTFKYYRRLIEASKAGKVTGEQKSMMNRVLQELAESKDRLEYLEMARKYLELMYAELYGLDDSLLLALARCLPEEPILLSPAPDNPLLLYQTVRKPRQGTETRALQAGTPEGLMAYLFARNAISEGFIHQFFYGFRYFVPPIDLLTFICDKYSAGALSLAPEIGMPAKVKVRALDLLQAWLEGYFTVDFKNSPEMLQHLNTFINTKKPKDPALKRVVKILDRCLQGQNYELTPLPRSQKVKMQIDEYNQDPKKLDAEIELEEEWDTFKASLSPSRKPRKLNAAAQSYLAASNNCTTHVSKETYGSHEYHLRVGSRRSDSFTLADYTAKTIAEQLTLMEQELFEQTHPVHYLNTRAQGISVQLAHPVLSRSQSVSMLSGSVEQHFEGNLFVGSHNLDDIMQQMIEHAQCIAFWVSAEVLCCTSAKMQVALLCKLLNVAHLCYEMRNFATCLSILEGLENLLVRQLPAWKSVPTKSAATMDELAKFKLSVKSETSSLTSEEEWRSRPTIPSLLYFLVHIQQMEIGSFTLVNGMYKWTKIKAIARQVDQIRAFKQHSFNFEPDPEFHEAVRERIREFGQHDLQVLAAQHQNNYQKVSSSSRKGSFGGTFRRLKHRLQGKSDG